MNTEQIIADLEAERDRLETAIAALRGNGRRNGRRRKKRTMSAEARRKIGEAQKRRWRAQKLKAKA